MAKRKAQEVFEPDNSPSKRLTRSSSALKAVQPSVGTPTRRKKSNQVEQVTSRVPPVKRVYGRNARVLDSSSLKENENSDDEDEESEADELNIGPDDSKLEEKVAPTKRPKRVAFDAVVITTPTKPKKNSQPRGKAKTPVFSPLTRLPDAPSEKSPAKKSAIRVPATSSPVKPHHDETRTVSIKDIESCPTNLPLPLPPHLLPCLNAQKRIILDTLLAPPTQDGPNHAEDDEQSANAVTLQHLRSLLGGTIRRGEGNSCLVIGPAGSGKTKVFDEALGEFAEEKPIIVRLNGHVHRTDRLAMREIARQVVEQTGNDSFSALASDDDAENPFIDDETEVDGLIASLPPSTHLPSLISALPTLSRPVIVLLDCFDLFTHHPRQALLYCLLDTVQSCRAGSDTHRGLAVIGLTSRVDVINLLEKRVKSRFSHRTFRTAALRKVEGWLGLLRDCLGASINPPSVEQSSIQEWQAIWSQIVKTFTEDRSLKELLQDIFSISKDVRILQKIIANAVSELCAGSPYLSAKHMRIHVEAQRSIPRSDILSRLSYPQLSLLIAAEHMRTSGHDTFTFEMLRDAFQNQVRISSAAPVTFAGSSIGMMNVGRGILMGAFEHLVGMRIFLPTAPATAGSAKEFIKHRSLIGREDVKRAVDSVGQTNLRKWFHKAQ